MVEEWWVRCVGGPEDGEYILVELMDGRLPPLVQIEERAQDRLVVHAYELLQDRAAAAKAAYRFVDPEG